MPQVLRLQQLLLPGFALRLHVPGPTGRQAAEPTRMRG